MIHGTHKMTATMCKQSNLKLSICITTFNRAAFIGATLESILSQVTDDCEIIILDGGSSDDTENVVSEYTQRCDRLRYIRQETNKGFDRDCDRVVELASGEYCWLTSDDDLLKPGAVTAVIGALRRDLSLIVLNVEARDFGMARVVQSRWLDIASDRLYGPDDMDRLFVDIGDRLKYVGGIVFKRSIWLARDRERYYGSWFVFVGVIFQQALPGEALLLAEPLISFRLSNTPAWSPHVIEIVWFKWPALVWSLAPSDSAKSKVCSAEPWRALQELLVWRGLGCYSLKEYRRWIRPRLRSVHNPWAPPLVALLPGVLVNAFLLLYYSVTRRPFQGWRQPALMLQVLRDSRYYFRNWVFKRAS